MPVRHVVLALSIAVVWGVNFTVIDVGLETMPPLLFAALRFALTAFPGVLVVGRPGVALRWVVAMGLFIGAGQFGLLFVGMDQGMPAGLASLVIQLQAVFTVGLAVVTLGERPGRVQLLGAAVALGGIGIIAAGRSAAVPAVAFALVVGAALSWAVGNVCTRAAQSPNPVGLLVWSSLVAPVPLAALSLLLEGPEAIGAAWSDVSVASVLSLLYVVVGATAFGFGGWSWLLRRHPASRVAPFALLVPVVGIATAWIALGERPSAVEALGAVVVLAGLALTTRAVRLPAGRGLEPGAAPAGSP
jgi:O-acetylserine/cysteine efflux transporter